MWNRDRKPVISGWQEAAQGVIAANREAYVNVTMSDFRKQIPCREGLPMHVLIPSLT